MNQTKNSLTEDKVEHHFDEELIILSKDLHKFAVQRLTDLRQTYGKNMVPEELNSHERFLKSIISDTAVFLSETFNWPT